MVTRETTEHLDVYYFNFIFEAVQIPGEVICEQELFSILHETMTELQALLQKLLLDFQIKM